MDSHKRYIQVEVLCSVNRNVSIHEIVTSPWCFNAKLHSLFHSFFLNRIIFSCVIEIPIDLPKKFILPLCLVILSINIIPTLNIWYVWCFTNVWEVTKRGGGFLVKEDLVLIFGRGSAPLNQPLVLKKEIRIHIEKNMTGKYNNQPYNS